MTLGLLVNMKNILDNLSIFGSRYSASGSNTANAYVDTVYSYNFGFWLVLVSFLLAALLLPLFFILSHQARRYRTDRSSAHYYGSEYGSSFSFSENDGPILPPKGSKEPLRSPSYIVRETTQNVTYNNPNLSYDLPPMAGSSYDATTRRYVRFDGNQGAAAAGATATSTVTTTVTKQILKEEAVASPHAL